MEKNSIVYIDDILFSMSRIENYIAGIRYEIFSESYDIQDKVLRRLEIIAEAAKKLPDELRNQYPLIPWKSIIGLRNIIAHNYDEVNLQEIWDIITIHLPVTKKQIEDLRDKCNQKLHT